VRELRTGQERGEIRSDIDPEVKALEITAFSIGIETQWLLAPDLIDREKVHRSFARALIDDLTREDAPRLKTRSGSRARARTTGPARGEN
jgi:BetI-type transcriptional repressor, C-terminal